jgi:hypothetical protein
VDVDRGGEAGAEGEAKGEAVAGAPVGPNEVAEESDASAGVAGGDADDFGRGIERGNDPKRLKV